MSDFRPYPKPDPRPKKQPKPLSNKRKPTGEAEMFREIWEEREHYCTNCPSWLGDEMRAHFFDHIKGKGSYPELRLVKENIQLLCLECHDKKQFGTKAQFEARKNIFKKV